MESYSSAQTQSWLSWFLKGVLIVGFLVLAARLYELQVVKGSYFRMLSEGNRIRRIEINAPRGNILGRGGEVLVGNREVSKLVVFDPETGFEKVDATTSADSNDLIVEWVRDYGLGEQFAHVSGYLGEFGSDEVDKVNPKCPNKGPRKLGKLTGRSGLEEMYECTLSGKDGEELVEVDSGGNKIRTLGKRNPVPGSDIKTTIHFGLQKKVAELFSETKGAAVVTDVNGEVLAMYSSPSYDPNIFIKKGNSEKIRQAFEDEDLPLFNRVIGGAFHPGSVFKPIVAVAALEEEIIDEKYTYDDPGIITIDSPYGTFSYSNWYFTQYQGREGKIGLARAITRSTDTFFYKLGELLGIDALDSWANKFGLGDLTGIDIPGEIAGLVPSPLWKEKVRKEPWFLGNTYHMSIGQGDITLTPIGINSAIAAIANDGLYCTPHILFDEGLGNDPPGQRPFGPEANFRCKDLGISKETISIVKEGMVGACSPGGTGFTFFDFSQKTNVSTACKTGTAETDEKGKTHAWFSAFAPYESVEIVATILVEKGGEGAYVAGPIAREIFDYWFTANQ